jgi:hypothetical protein
VLAQRDAAGRERLTAAIELSAADIDQSLTFQVREALLREDLNQATSLLQAANHNSSRAEGAPAELTLSADAWAAVRDGRAQFFRLSLADSCSDDGDVVEFSVSGQSPTVIPISHEGHSVTFLLLPGAKTLTLRGIHDGGGGITVMYQSSQGHFVSQTMEVGEEWDIPIVVR